jgi:hypothetical protein
MKAVSHVASEQKHLTGALMGAAALGFAKKQGYNIPHVEVVGEAGTLALAGWALDKFGVYRARWLRHAVTAFASIALYEAVSTGNIPLLSEKKKKDKAEGDDDVDGAYDIR